VIGLLLALYPARWRRRYGEEFRAMLESRPLGPFDVADVLLGALDARSTRFRLLQGSESRGGQNMVLRMGGYGAVSGGVLWFVGLAASGIGGTSNPIWMWVGGLGTFGLLVAVTGLSAFQAHRHPRLAWAAFAIPAIGSAASVIGLVRLAMGPGDDPIIVGSIGAWSVWIVGLLATLVGSIVFAVATLRADVLSRHAARALAISSAAVLVLAFGTWGIDTETFVAQALLFVCLGSFAASWIALGVSALRRGPIRAIASA
jgi:hypothetical protein